MGQGTADGSGLRKQDSAESMKYYTGVPSYVLGRTLGGEEDLKVKELDTKEWTVFGVLRIGTNLHKLILFSTAGSCAYTSLRLCVQAHELFSAQEQLSPSS